MEAEEDKVVPMKDQNALVMGNGKVYKIQKVRQRKIHSCVPCHQRKVKCSRDHPVCQNCIKNNLECKYFINDRVSRGKKNKDIDKESDLKKKKELKQYIEKAKVLVSSDVTSAGSSVPPTEGASVPITHMIKPNVDDLMSPSHDSPSSLLQQTTGQVSNNMVTPPDFKTEYHTQASNSMNSNISIDMNSVITPPKDEESPDSTSSTNESLSPPKLNHPNLPTGLKEQSQTQPIQQQPLGSTLLGNEYDQQTPPVMTDFTSMSKQSSRLPFSDFPSVININSTSNVTSNIIPNNFTPNPINPTNNNNSTNNQSLNNINLCLPQILIPKPANSIPMSKLEEFFSSLPTKERSYALIKRYRNSVHPVIPILDIKDFEKQHDLFWENGIDKKLEFLSILYPVLYAASKTECFEFSYDEITKFELSNEIHKYLRVARSLLHALEYPTKFSLRTVQSVVLLHTTLENPPIIDMAILIRVAQSLNLHRDPATYHNIADASLVQLRRLLWWEIFYLDAMTSYKNQSAPVIRLDDFDTSLPVEFFYNQLNYSICYLNGKFRYTLILNELTRFMYGLTNVSYYSIQTIKQKILDLHISCNASIINLESYIKNNSDVLNYDELNFIKWAKSTLTTYCDRSVLILQKKIILKNILSSNDDNNSSIFNNSYNQMVNNKKSRFSITDAVYNPQNEAGVTYSFDDLSNNLIPASLHYLYEFLKNNNDDIYNLYNWEIRNNLPFDAILIILTNLITDLEKNVNKKNYELRNDIRYYLLDKVIDLIFIKFDNKKRSIIKNCFTLIRYLFQILRLRFLSNDNANPNSLSNSGSGNFIKFDPYYTEQIIPKPVHDSDIKIGKNQRQLQSSTPTFSHPLNTTSCSQIAPRTMRAIAGTTGSISFSEVIPFNNISVSDMFINGLTSEIGYTNYNTPNHSLGNSRNNSVSNLNASNNLFFGNGQANVDQSYKEHELQRIKLQISKFLREERLADDDRFNNKFYVDIEKEVKELIERLI